MKLSKVTLTDKLIKTIRFEDRIMGVDSSGNVVTEPVKPDLVDYYIQDAKIEGFSLRVWRTGNTAWVIRKRLGGRICTFICGRLPEVPLDEARRIALKALLSISNGLDPNHKKEADIAATHLIQDNKKNTFKIAFHSYSDSRFFPGFSAMALAEVKSGLKEGTIKDTFSIKTAQDHKDVEKWLTTSELWKSPFVEIKMDLIEKAFRPFYDKDTSTGNKLLSYCRAAWNHATIGVENATRNPFKDWNSKYIPPKTPRRATYLATSSEDGEKWLRTIASWRKDSVFHRRVMADYILLTLIWGTRKNEALPLKFETIFFDKDALMIPETKNGSAHWIPITPLVKQILLARIQDNKAPRNVKKHIVDTPYVFPSRFFDKHLTEPSALLEKADQESGLTIRLHDLRRTFAGEIFNKSGRDSLTTKLAMNHSSGTDDITASYMMIEPKLEALRPLFEEREKRLFKIAEVFEAEETKPEEALELKTA